MNRKAKYVLLAIVFMVSGSTILTPTVYAEEAKFELKPGVKMWEVLAERTGKRTTLRMQSGEDIEGVVVRVGDGLVHVSKLAGKEYYDAMVNIDRISAVIVRVRDH